MRALIVDDDKTFCQFVAEVLGRKGIEAEWTTQSLVGYEMSLRSQYDFFILDVRMPSLLGPELAEKLKKDNPNAKIILISAFVDKALRATANNLGVALLSKPFRINQLLVQVTGILGVQV